MSFEDGMASVKAIFKKYPRFYRALTYIFAGPTANTTASKFVASLPRGIKIIDIGSGPRKLRDDVTCIDVFKFDNVDIVTDATNLPFENESIDVSICDNVLEHVRDPKKVIAEILRVLKKDGLVYVAVPFVIPYHSSPDDFYRWSEPGLRELLKDFEEQELNIQFGPTAAMTMVFAEWFGLLVSFNTTILYKLGLFLATIITVPLKLLDLVLVHYKRANILPLTFYFIGKKN